MMSRPNISAHISFYEYACKHCSKLPPDFYTLKFIYQELFDMFEHLRLKWGKPIPVESGYRCPDHNSAVGGAPLSPHLFGMALDLTFPDKMNADAFATIVDRERPDLRMGRYISKPGLVHIDTAYLIRPRATTSWARGVRWLNP